MGNRQELDWGSIDWVYEPESGSNDSMHIGVSRMKSGSVQPRHIHSGDEQFMYIISGRGRQKIGDVEQPLEPGAMYHISAGTSHEAVNDGGEDIVKLLISVPARVGVQKPEQPAQPETAHPPAEPAAFLREAVRSIEKDMLSSLKLPLSIYDVDGTPVYQNREYPQFCRSCCGIMADEKACVLYREKNVYQTPQYTEPSAFVCPYGLSLYVLAICCDGQLLGLIRAGHVRTAPASAELPFGTLPYNVPHSTVTGILQVMKRISESICELYRHARMEHELACSQQALSDRQEQEQLLQSSLRTSQSQAANLQINQHFLFNTLNMMMSTAIREGAEQTYQAIGQLAQMMQYTLRSAGYFTTLRRELEYVRNYTSLQKMRFGSRLHVTYEVAPGLLNESVPLNFLQPIVENCFKHAFPATAETMKIGIRIWDDGGQLAFCVTDNGCGMDPERLAHLTDLAANGSAEHGTAMVMRKLSALYGQHCRYEVRSGPAGTEVTLRIPKQGREAR